MALRGEMRMRRGRGKVLGKMQEFQCPWKERRGGIVVVIVMRMYVHEKDSVFSS